MKSDNDDLSLSEQHNPLLTNIQVYITTSGNDDYLYCINTKMMYNNDDLSPINLNKVLSSVFAWTLRGQQLKKIM